MDSFCDTRICDETIGEDHQVTLIQDDNDFYFGQEYNNKPKGQGIRITSDGNIYIQKWNGWYYDDEVGPFLQIFSDGNIAVGEYYLDAKQQKKDRYTHYLNNGNIGNIVGQND